MSEEPENQEIQQEEEGEESGRNLWAKPKRNWGMWVLIIGFILFLITWYVIKPRLEAGG